MVGKPKNDIAMSSTERSRRYRECKKKLGGKEVNIILPAGTLQLIDELMDFFELPNRATAIHDLVKPQLAYAVEQMLEMKKSEDYMRVMPSSDSNIAKELGLSPINDMWNLVCLGQNQQALEIIKNMEAAREEQQ